MSRPSASTLLLVTIFLAACGGGDSTSPGQHTQSLQLGVSPGTVSVPSGGTTTLTVTITRSGGLSGNVTLLMEGVPSGVTVSFSPNPLTGAVSSSTMTIVVAPTAAIGRFLMTVRAASPGVDEVGAQIWLDIVQPFTLRAARDAIPVIQGATGQLEVTVTRASGFAGDVALSLEGSPAGVSATFAPNPATADRSTLALRVDSSVASRKYTLTVKGTAASLPTQSATFVLDVLAGAAPTFTLEIRPAALTVVSGGSGVPAAVIVHRTGGFAGAVSVSVQGHPNGVTFTCVPAPITDTTATLTFTAAPGLLNGTYALTVTAAAEGYPSRQAALQLTVQEVAGFWLSLSTSSITSAPGAAPQTLSIQITRTGGFVDTVHLSMTGLPTGITATFNPPATLANATLIIAVVSASPGTYTGTLHATATGQAERTTRLTITVLTGGTSVTWRFCSPSPTPVFFAFQDGVSPFVVVTPAGDGSYVTSVASGRGAVAFVVPGLPDTTDAAGADGAARASRIASTTASGYTTYLYYGTTADLQQVAEARCPTSGAPGTVRGSVAGLRVGDAWTVGLAGASALGLPGGGTAFTLTDVLPGPRDLVAGRAPFGETQTLADALIIRRDVNALDGSTLPVLDFAGAEAFAPAAGTLAVTGIPAGDSTEVVLGFTTANGTSALIGRLGSVTGASRPIAGLPSDRLRAGDLHTARATAESSNPAVDLSATLYAARVGTWTLTLATPPPLPVVDVLAVTPLVRLRARGNLGAPGSAFSEMVHVSFIQADAGRATVVYQSRNYIGTTWGFEIRTGGYNSLAGWSEATYGLRTGALTTFTVELLNAGYAFAPADGSIVNSFRTSGQLMP